MKELKPEKFFAIFAIIFGIIFIFLTPPFQSPDEDSHFKKAYLTSIGKFYPTVKNEKQGNSLPKEMIKYIDEKLTYIGDRDKKYKYSESVLDQYSTMNHEGKNFNSYSTSSTLFIAYIPSAIGIIFSKLSAKIFGMENISVSYMLYFARLFALIFSVFIIHNAIKTTPILKKSMVVVALMPMSLFLMGMITYDSIIIALSLLAIAFILKLIFDEKIKKINWKQILTLIALGFILFNYKTLYCVLFILLFFIPREKFGSMKNKIIKFMIIAFSILGLTVLFKLPFLLLPSIEDPSSQLVGQQLQYVLNNLTTYFSILIENIIDQRAFQLTSMVGLFGLIDTYLPLPIVTFYLFLILFIALTEGSEYKYKISKLMKVALIFTIVAGVVAIFSAMYISWTPKVVGEVGTRHITGVQGRYFIPLLFPCLLVLSNKVIKGKYIDIAKKNYQLGIVVTLIISTITILLRFWV